MSKLSLLLCILLSLAFLSCSKDDDDNDDTAYIRLINSSYNSPPLALVDDNEAVAGNVAFGSASDYTDVDSTAQQKDPRSSPVITVDPVDVDDIGDGDLIDDLLDDFEEDFEDLQDDFNDNVSDIRDQPPANIRIQDSKSFTIFAEGVFQLIDQLNYTFVALSSATNMSLLYLRDDASTPASGQVKIRLIDGVSTVPGKIDIYVTRPSVSVSDIPPSAAGFKFLDVSRYIDGTPGQFTLQVTAANSSTVLFSQLLPQFEEKDVWTIIVTDDPSGRMAFSVLSVLDNN